MSNIEKNRKLMIEQIQSFKKPLNENTKVAPIEIADTFVRFLIGDRSSAIRELEKYKSQNAEFGIMESPGSAEYNKQFGKLTKLIETAIKSGM